jgi:hypothetical protein
MFVLKSGIGAKIALGALGLVLGIGGVAAGARFHAAHNTSTADQRLFIGHITAVSSNEITIRTARSQTITIHLLLRTVIRHKGVRVAAAALVPGDDLLVLVRHASNGDIDAVIVSIIKVAPTAQGP